MAELLNPKQEQLYEALSLNPYLSQQDLSKMLGLSRSAVANLLSDLNAKGYIIGKPYELNKNRIITCIGGANIDSKMTGFSAIQMHTSNPVKKSSSLGGVIRNVAENLARLSKEVSLMTKVGDDSDGNMILTESSKMMYVFATDIDKNNSTGSYTAILNPDGELVLGLADMKICDDMDRNWIMSHRAHVSVSRTIACDTNIKKDAIEALTEIKKDSRIIIIGVSTIKVKNIPEDLRDIYLCILNMDEAKAYTKVKDENLSEIEKSLRNSGLKRGIITLGQKGAYYFDQDNKSAIIEAHRVENVIDVTGAGDSFCAGVIYAISQDKDIETAVRYGQKIASLTIQSKESVRKDLSNRIFDDIK